MAHAMFRPRRLREKGLLRRMVRETTLAIDDFVYPLFAVHGRGVREPIGSMPGVFHLSVDEIVKEAKDAAGMGIPAVLLFGLPEEKDGRGQALRPDAAKRRRARCRRGTRRPRPARLVHRCRVASRGPRGCLGARDGPEASSRLP